MDEPAKVLLGKRRHVHSNAFLVEQLRFLFCLSAPTKCNVWSRLQHSAFSKCCFRSKRKLHSWSFGNTSKHHVSSLLKILNPIVFR